MIKKFFLSLTIAFLLFTSTLSNFFVSRAYAQESGTWYNQDFKEWWAKVYDESASPQSEIFGERYTAAQVQWVIYGLFAFVLNATSGDPTTTSCLMNNDLVDCADRVKKFFTSAKEANRALAREKPANFWAFMWQDRPVSGITYFKNISRQFRLIPEAQAQTGFGFTALDPILPLWRAVRNATYALFVIVILAISFMIMFRVKISPQVVISVQSALPKITAALILVTFSYAIAGLLIDFMYVVIGFLSLVISSAINISGWSPAPVGGFLGVFGFLTEGFLGFGAIGLSILYLALFWIVALITFVGSNGVGGVIGSLGGILAGGIILSILLAIVLAILLIWVVIRIFWMLLKAFASALLLVVAAPLQILLGAISPSWGFGGWLKTYIANLAVFPATGLLFALAFIFLIMAVSSIDWGFNIGEFFTDLGLGFPLTAPFVAASLHKGWPPLLVFGVKNSLSLLFLGVSVFVLFLIPKLADIIKAMIEGKPFGYGSAIGETITPFYKLGVAGGAAGTSVVEKADIETARLTGVPYVPRGLVRGFKSFFGIK